MLPNNELVALAHSAESQYLERKASCPKTSELRKTLCAFANSTPENQLSVLFIGIRDDGTISGVPERELDSIQKTIASVGKNECYPPILVVPQVVSIDQKSILAVLIEYSRSKPHFTGHAYKRRGSESERASEIEHTEFVLDRIDKVRKIRKEKGLLVSAEWEASSSGFSPSGVSVNKRDYVLVDCDAFVLCLEDTVENRKIPIPTEKVTISYDFEKERLKLVMGIPYPIVLSSLSAVNRGLAAVVKNIARVNM